MSAFLCIDGNDPFLWCLREDPVAHCELRMRAECLSGAMECAYTKPLDHEIGNEVHFTTL